MGTPHRHTLAMLAVAAVAMVATACGDPQAPAAEQRRGDAGTGAALFADNCAACHGTLGRGTASGPPFLSDVYVPSHHSDEAFQVAVAVGVRPHHWNFGAMPPVEGLTRDQVADIIAYVRQLQAEAGLIE